MSKNITIKEGGTSRSFTAEKLRTNLQGGGTCDWVPIDEVDKYVELEELSVTENGIYYPAEKVGISKVTVDVQGSGGGGVVPSGTTVRAVAAENLTAGDCVYILKGGAGGNADITPAYFSNGNHSYVQIAFDGTYVYFTNPTNRYDTTIYRLNKNNLIGTPEIYLSGLDQINCLTRNLIAYRTLDSGTYTSHIQNVKMNIQKDNLSIADSGLLTKDYVYVNGFYTIIDLNLALSYSQIQPFHRMINRTDSVNITVNGYHLYKNGAYIKYVTTDTQIYEQRYCNNVIGSKIIVYKNSANSSNLYEIGYIDVDADDGVFYNILDKNGNKLQSSQRLYMKYNAEGTILFVMCGTEGLALIYNDLSVVKYDNITGVGNNRSEMFGDYFFDAAAHILYYIPQSSTMGKTNDKNHAGSLGFVQVDIPAGVEGNAIEMFR